MAQPDFSTESTKIIRFPSFTQFRQFRAEVEDRYSARMVRVSNKDGSVEAIVSHASNLGTELRGLAYGRFDGVTVAHNDH